jgi:hypothetical protein
MIGRLDLWETDKERKRIGRDEGLHQVAGQAD